MDKLSLSVAPVAVAVAYPGFIEFLISSAFFIYTALVAMVGVFIGMTV